MAARITLFPVGNGDMTLIELESGRNLLIDTNIRAAADDPDDPTPDVASLLKERLPRDAEGRPFLDVFLLSHPDQDHCAGLRRHFHLGPPEDYPEEDEEEEEEKIFINEVWSSPMVFRRASSQHKLCDDAKAFNREARRRVQRYRDSGTAVTAGDRILVLGADEDGKTDDLDEILVRVDEIFERVNGTPDESFQARLLSPLPKSEDEEEEELRAKNRSSTILAISLTGGGLADACRFLTGGDAGVAIWERLWERHENHPDWLEYDVLQAPHHCSWRSLSHDSWSELGEKAEVSPNARQALGQARPGAAIVASSKAIADDDSDPPCIRAKREYEAIADAVNGAFHCVGEPEDDPQPLEMKVDQHGARVLTALVTSFSVIGSGAVGAEPLAHG